MLGSLTEACGDSPGAICEWVYDRTDGNDTLAKLADWFVNRPLQILMILVAAWLLSKLARRWIRRVVQRIVSSDREMAARQLRRIGVRPPPMLTTEVADPRRETRALAISGLIGSTASALIWTIAVMLAVGRVGLDLGPLIAGAGIAGIALGFGAQSLVKDWISGLFMTLEDQYGVGDVIDVGEASGVVERITLRATVLRGVDGTVWHVPNGQIVRVGNRSQLWSVALVDVTVGYDADLERAGALLHDVATELCARDEFAPNVLEAPQVLGVEALGADGVTLRLVVKVAPGSQWTLQRALRQAIKSAFEANGVAVPFHQRTVWMPASPTAGDPPSSALDE
ncbi:MAG TPA: mechanosensitive ion channel family protein [Ilumatobacteraceae bacterium]|nr:mechanosensitive ion channel family protein [Ilumatobacteraceae bacterium]